MMISAALLIRLWTAAQPTPVTCPAGLESAFAAVEQSLVDVEYELDNIRERALRKRLRQKLRDAKSAMVRAKNESCEMAEPSTMPFMPPEPPASILPPPPPHEGVAASERMALLGEKAFRSLWAALESEAFSDGKLAVLHAGVREVCVNVDQAKALLEGFAFSADRLRGANVLVPRVKDRANLPRLYPVMKFSTDQEALVELVNQLEPEPRCQQESTHAEEARTDRFFE